jgi:hypothetical protein
LRPVAPTRRPALLIARLVLSAAVVAATLVAVPVEASVAGATRGVTILQSHQSSESAVRGPATLAAAQFAHPTRRGNLLLAAVLCGVLRGGMKVPALSLPNGWRGGVRRTGGILGGLEASIYYWPDNPGGVTSLALGTVSRGAVVWCTTFTWEVSGAGPYDAVVAAGTASVIGGTAITVRTSRRERTGDLVLAAETDGSEVPHNVYHVSSGFILRSQWDNGHVDQPGTFSYMAPARPGVGHVTISQSSNWLDACAVILALDGGGAQGSRATAR